MNEVGLKNIHHKSESVELSDIDFEEFIVISPEKNFVITFKDESGVLISKLESRDEKKEIEKGAPDEALSMLYHHKQTLGNSSRISDLEKLVDILQDYQAKADNDSKKIIDFELKYYLGKLAQKEYIKSVVSYRKIKREIENASDYTRELDDKLQELKQLKETCIATLKTMKEPSQEIPNEIQEFLDSYEKQLEEKNFNFIFQNSIVSGDSEKINAAIVKLESILREASELLTQAYESGDSSLMGKATLGYDDTEKIQLYISGLKEQLEKQVKETLDNIHASDPR